MKVKVFHYDQKKDYKNLLEDYSLHLDIYYDFDFLICDADLQGGVPEIFVAIDGDDIIVYPYIRLPFKNENFEKYSDAVSPYGYAGPVTNSSTQQFLLKAEKALIQHFITTNTVTEFIRYHYNDSFCFSKNIENEENRTIILLSLTDNWENIWQNNFTTKNRNLIRKLIKEGYEIEEWTDETAMPKFFQMYTETMDNVGASDFYYFDLKFLNSLRDKLGNKMRIFRIVKDGITYASSLFFFENKKVTYYLSARNLNHPKVPATNYLLAKVVEMAHDEENEYFNFGGGTTNDADDSLYKFKLNFSKNQIKFYIGKRIHLPKVYEDIKQYYINKNGLESFESKKHILQFYRA